MLCLLGLIAGALGTSAPQPLNTLNRWFFATRLADKSKTRGPWPLRPQPFDEACLVERTPIRMTVTGAPFHPRVYPGAELIARPARKTMLGINTLAASAVLSK